MVFDVIEKKDRAGSQGDSEDFLAHFLFVFGSRSDRGITESRNDSQLSQGGFTAAFGVSAEEES
jgi:hypothetical protein